MAEITDIAMRQMLVKYGKPDVLYTEFVSADGLANEKGRQALMKNLHFEENERPIVAQIFGAQPENIRKAARLVRKLGFDGLDINMGCPDRAVIKQGAGSALIKNPQLAREIIRAAKEGAGDMPVSVKTRIGFNTNEIETWITEILKEKPAALIIHGRTRKQLFGGQADWDAIARVAQMAKDAGVICVGNGDVKTKGEALEKISIHGVDGVMIGRAFFGNPWLCADKKSEDITIKERSKALIEHLNLNLKYDGDRKFHEMKKHIAMYVKEFDGARDLRVTLMECENVGEVEKHVDKYLQHIV